MKKIMICIIMLSSFFSSIFSVSAQNWFLSDLLEIQTGLEVYDLENIPKLASQNFSSAAIQETYNEFIRVDTLLRNEFIRQYRNWDISYYQISDIIKNYKDFLYYTNITFWYISETERWLRGPQIRNAISDSYSNMRMSYNRVINILK